MSVAVLGTGDAIPLPPESWERFDAAVRDEIARASGIRRFVPIDHLPAGATTVPAGERHMPSASDSDGSLTIGQSRTIPVVELTGQVALTAEQAEAEASSGHALAGVRRIARGLVALEDSLVLCGRAGLPATLLSDYGLRAMSPEGMTCLLDSAMQSHAVTTSDGEDVAFSFVTGIEDGLQALHVAGLDGPYTVVLPMRAHRLLRSRLPTRDVPASLLPGDVELATGMRALSDECGLLLANGGRPSELLVESDTFEVRAAGRDAHGRFVLQLRHRFALRVREPAAVLRLELG